MQSEAGAAGAVHGALQAGALTTTFTASQGLLLMLPNMYKIAGELTPAVFHVAARALATQALSIFGDHSDVMAARATGFAHALLRLGAGGARFRADRAGGHARGARARSCISSTASAPRTRSTRSRCSSDADLRAMIDEELVRAHRAARSRPTTRSCAAPRTTPTCSSRRARRSTRSTRRARRSCRRDGRASPSSPGAPTGCSTTTATRRPSASSCCMGSGAETARETVGSSVRRGREGRRAPGPPLSAVLGRAFPCGAAASVRAIAVLDRTKEPGRDRRAALPRRGHHARRGVAQGRRDAMPRVIGGRYGLSSKDFTPAMVKAVFDELRRTDPKNHFTVGIDDDVIAHQPRLRSRPSTSSPTT